MMTDEVTVIVEPCALGERMRCPDGSMRWPKEALQYLRRISNAYHDQGGRMHNGHVRLVIDYYLTPAESWSEKKRKAAIDGRIIPTCAPCVLDMNEAVMEALTQRKHSKLGAWHSRNQISMIMTRKRYSTEPRICISVSSEEGAQYDE